jgi:hypothetical protein
MSSFNFQFVHVASSLALTSSIIKVIKFELEKEMTHMWLHTSFNPSSQQAETGGL